MKIEQVNQSIIGRRVKGVFTGAQVTGTIDKVTETAYTVEVHIVLDKPIWWGDDEYTSYWSTARKEDGWGNLQHTEFIDDLDWLKDYQPKDKHFTSFEEVDMISEKLGLKDLTDDEVKAKRDAVVMYYHNLKKNETDKEKVWDYTTAMMSVTAAIDYIKTQRGMEV